LIKLRKRRSQNGFAVFFLVLQGLSEFCEGAIRDLNGSAIVRIEAMEKIANRSVVDRDQAIGERLSI
jgi:hypothetical protein